MTINDLELQYDGVCVYATSVVKSNATGKLLLTLFNILLLGIITVFIVGQVPAAAIVFSILELFLIKYTLWNLFGEERLIINEKSLSYQQHYGFFTTSWNIISLHKRVSTSPYQEIKKGDQTYVTFIIKSYNEQNLSEVIYHSVLHISKDNFDRFTQHLDRLFLDEMINSHYMPPIHLN